MPPEWKDEKNEKVEGIQNSENFKFFLKSLCMKGEGQDTHRLS